MSTIGNGLRIILAAVICCSVAGCESAKKAQKQLRTAVDAKKPALDQCYAEALERDVRLQGRMQLWVHVDHDSGRVDRVQLGPRSDVEDEELGSCVADALEGIQLEKKPPANLRVEYTLDLQPQEADTSGGESPSESG